MSEIRTTVSVPADHPALPGHFPGRPVVPGVVWLAEVAAVARERLGFPAGATRWRRVRFLAPVGPEREVTMTLAEDRGGFRFLLTTADGQPVARGQCRHDPLE